MAFLFVESSSSQYSNISVVQNAVKALKLLFFSAGLISTLLMVKGALMPFLYEIFFPNLVAFWNSFRYFLSSPLYICIIINSVVLLIAVTSTFHHDHDHEHNHDPPPPRWVEVEVEETTLLSTNHHTSTFSRGSDDHIDDSKTRDPAGKDVSLSLSLQDDKGSHHIEKTLLSRDERLSLQDDKGSHYIEKTQEDSPSRDERESETDDTIDSTWRTIVEGKTEKKLTKSESVPPRSRIDDPNQHSSTAKWKELRKLETFNDGVSIRRLGGLRRDPSIGLDEFNLQVEAFIKKFNEDMRLQRQESDQRFLDMVKRGL